MTWTSQKRQAYKGMYKMAQRFMNVASLGKGGKGSMRRQLEMLTSAALALLSPEGLEMLATGVMEYEVAAVFLQELFFCFASNARAKRRYLMQTKTVTKIFCRRFATVPSPLLLLCSCFAFALPLLCF